VTAIDLGNALSANPLAALPLVFAGGVLASLTPCIYPMIPITVAIVGGQSLSATSAHGMPALSRWRSVALTLAYAGGLATVYAGLGLFAGLTGTLFGGVSTNPWASFAQANLLLLFGLMMLDAVPVPVPSFLLQRASALGIRGRAAGAFAMGAASGVVAAPCGAPVFGAVLTWVTRTQSAGLGFLYLLTFSAGMSALLVVAGLASGTAVRLPRAGAWMVWVKKGFGILLLGMAEYYFIEMGRLLS